RHCFHRSPRNRSTYLQRIQARNIPPSFLFGSGGGRANNGIRERCIFSRPACPAFAKSEMMTGLKLQKLRNEMAQHEVEAFLITSEFNLRYITEFTGSSGLAIVTEDKAY